MINTGASSGEPLTGWSLVLRGPGSNDFTIPSSQRQTNNKKHGCLFREATYWLELSSKGVQVQRT